MWMLLHGFTGSAETWDEVVELAVFDQEPLRPSLAGHGNLDELPSSFEAELSRLASIASESERPRFLCGYSLGARLALGLLLSRPELFDAAVLIGVHPGLEDDATRGQRRKLDAERAGMLRQEGLDAFVAAWERLPLFESQRELPEAALQRQRSMRLSKEPEGLARSLELLGLAEMPSYRAGVASLALPVIWMAGSRDAKFRDLALELAGSHPAGEARIVEGAGHNLPLEAPGAVAAALKHAEQRVGGEAKP